MSFSIFNSKIWKEANEKELKTDNDNNQNPKEIVEEILNKLSEKEEQSCPKSLHHPQIN